MILNPEKYIFISILCFMSLEYLHINDKAIIQFPGGGVGA